MLLLLAVALIAGVLTVLSPCILPVLPIILAAGATGKRRRPFGVGVGFIASFTCSAALLASLIAATGLPASTLRILAIGVILAMGVVLLLPALRTRMEALLSRLGRLAPQPREAPGGDFGSGVLVGLSAGLVCAPCAGPVLTAVATLAATSSISTGLIAVAAAYATGLAIPLTAVGMGAQSLTRRLRWTARLASPLAGALLLATGVGLALGFDQRAELWAASATTWTGALQAIEERPAVVQQLARLRGQDLQAPSNLPALQNYGLATPFVGLTNWLNSPPLTMQQLGGKVVLVDFWTYSCVNCVRELPHLEAWYQRYAPDGFVVVGVHTPEFSFEHNPANVANAVTAQHVTFPVALDNSLATWNAYRNLAWPELYLVDANGIVQYIHVGEGDYQATEAAIRTLLTEAGNAPSQNWTGTPDTSPPVIDITAETYLGANHLHALASPQNAQVGVAMPYSLAAQLGTGNVALQGIWTLQPEYVQADSAGALALRFYADRVYIVLTPAAVGQAATVLLDGAPIAAAQAGADVQHGRLTLDAPRLYSLVDLHGPPATHDLRLEFSSPGIQAYSFTFG
ncbi:MAG TPA: redoxin family protein [Chloroflexota bacterium]|nr:redoxin family protein [Chloroflexota bacterium]